MSRGTWFVVATLLAAGCTSSSGDSDDVAAQLNGTTEATTSTVASSAGSMSDDGEPSDSESSDSQEAETDSSPEAMRSYSDEVVVPPDGPSKTVYITRVSMSDTRVEVRWSTHDDGVEYHLHRLVRDSEQKPQSTEMVNTNRIHTTDDAGSFVDDDVESGTRYWYGLRAIGTDGQAVAHGWHASAAVTDTEPPSAVGSLSAVLENGEVLVSWTKPDDNYQLHSYTVYRAVGDEDPETLRSTWNLDQTAFIDEDPPSGRPLSYLVRAVDFHWNKSEPAVAVID